MVECVRLLRVRRGQGKVQGGPRNQQHHLSVLPIVCFLHQRHLDGGALENGRLDYMHFEGWVLQRRWLLPRTVACKLCCWLQLCAVLSHELEKLMKSVTMPGACLEAPCKHN